MLRPRRAMSAGQFAVLFLALSLAMFLVAGYAWSRGNVFAPAFALLDAAFIAAVLRWVWRQGERFEVIALDERRLEVRRSARPGPDFVAHPYWVRLRVDGDEDGQRVLLACQGRQVEVGAFLSPGERRDLAARLERMLAAARRRGLDQRD
ncbi:DUF2244 domain-containing protein [Arenimonas fontis]|uniref:DUF2244 domain-containing protein n=1 Tax=Arenimonas fontis TaxID=2608255 RepID=UPI002482CB28|nr:DUF2244 domain-containing protein [Arenimonas fontis]